MLASRFLGNLKAVLEKHMKLSAVAQNACSALMSLANNAGNQENIANEFGEILRSVLETHIRNQTVMEWCSGAILCIIQNESALRKFKSLNIVNFLTVARDSFSSNQNIVSWTRRILAKLNPPPHPNAQPQHLPAG